MCPKMDVDPVQRPFFMAKIKRNDFSARTKSVSPNWRLRRSHGEYHGKKSPIPGGCREQHDVPVLRIAHEAQRQDQGRLAALALRCVRGERDPFHRHRREGPRLLRGVAALQVRAGRHARAGPHLQAEVRAVLGDMADARGCRRGPPRRLRRRDMDRARLRGADSLQRRVRAVLAFGAGRDHGGVAVAPVAHRAAGDGRDRWGQRVRGGGCGRMAVDEGAEVCFSRVLPGQASNNGKAEAAGGHRAVRLGEGAAPHRHPRAGGMVARAPHAMVRLLGGLPRAAKRRGRAVRLHARAPSQGEVGAGEAGQRGDAVRLPRPRDLCQDFGRASSRNQAAMGMASGLGSVLSKKAAMASAGTL